MYGGLSELIKVFKMPADDCRSLLHDLDGLIEDIEGTVSGLSRVWYAIDVSEIIAYIEPFDWRESDGAEYSAGGPHVRRQPWRDMQLFEDDNPETVSKIDQAVMQFLFNVHPRTFILFRDHGEELDSTIRGIARSQLRTAQRLSAEWRMIENDLRTAGQRLNLNEIAELVEGRQGRLTEESVDRIVRLMRRVVPNLTRFFMTKPGASLRRFRELLEAGALEGLESVTISGEPLTDETVEAHINEEIRARLPQAMRQRRTPQGMAQERIADANAIDERVLAVLHASNQALAPTDGRIRLITRSAVMHDIDRTMHDWDTDKKSRYLLRHPRVFLILLAGDSDPTNGIDWEIVRRRARELRDKIDEFLKFVGSIEETGQDEPSGDIHQALVDAMRMGQDHFDSVKQEWRRLVDTVAVGTIGNPEAWERSLSEELDASLRENLKLVIKVVGAIHDHEGVREEFRSRIESFLDALPILYGASSYPIGFAKTIKEGREDAVPLAGTHFPYVLRFRSEPLRAWYDEAQRLGSMDIHRTMQLLGAPRGVADMAERLTATAYFFAVIDEWRNARNCVELAIRMGHGDSGPMVEEFLIAALAERCIDQVPIENRDETYRRAIELVKQGLDVSRSDRRLMAERAAQIFHWAGQEAPEARNLIGLAFEVGNAVLRMTTDRDDESWTLRAKVCNDRCFYYINEGHFGGRHLPMRNPARAEESVCDLVRLLQDWGKPEHEWPTNWADTIYWAEWKLRIVGGRETDLAEQHRVTIGRFERLVTRASTRRSQRLIEWHLNLVRHGEGADGLAKTGSIQAIPSVS